MSFLKYFILAFALLIITTQSSSAQDNIVIKFSYIDNNNSPTGMAVVHFKQLAESSTHGRVKIDIYPGGQLYKENEEIDALQLNAVQMLVPPLSKLASVGISEFELFDLPYLFPDGEALHRVTQGAIGRELFNKLQSKGIVGLGYWDNGFKNFSSLKPVHNPEDLRGLHIRIQQSKVLDAEIRCLGATPWSITAMPAPDSLQNKYIDGAETTISSFYANKSSSRRYIALTNHGYSGNAVIVNKNFWDDLPGELRIKLIKAMNESTKFANTLAQQQNDLDLATLSQSPKIVVYQPTKTEQEKWHQALLPLVLQTENHMNRDLVMQLIREIEKPKSHP